MIIWILVAAAIVIVLAAVGYRHETNHLERYYQDCRARHGLPPTA